MDKISIERSHIDILLSHVEKTSVSRWKVILVVVSSGRGDGKWGVILDGWHRAPLWGWRCSVTLLLAQF